MKKKFLAIALSACLVFPLALTACGGDEQHTISQEKWQQMLSTDNFNASIAEHNTHSGDDVFTNGYSRVSYSLIYTGNIIEKKHQWYNGDGVFDSSFFTYVKEVNGSQTRYGYYDNYEYLDRVSKTEQDFNGAIANYVALLDYAKENQSAFAFYNRKYATGFYQLDVAGTEIEDEVANILANAYCKNEGTVLAISDGIIYICSNLLEFDKYGNMSDGYTKISITFDKKMTNYFWEKKIDKKPTNFTVKCIDPNDATSLDTTEYYYEENGFRIYTPYLEDPTRRDGYFCLDKSTGLYKAYIQDENGAWSATEITESIFNAQRNATYNYVVGYILGNNETSFVFDGDYICQQPYLNFSFTDSGVKYTCQNFKMKLDQDGKIESATWNLYYELQGQRSPTYNYTLTAGDVELTYPTVKTATADAWARAINLANFSSVKIQKDNRCRIEFDGTNLFAYYYNLTGDVSQIQDCYAQKSGKYYHYNRENSGSGYSAWSKRELTQDDFNSWIREYLDFTYMLIYGNFTFDATTGTYKASSYVVNQYLTVTDATVTIVDGRITNLSYKENGEAHKLEITYAPVTVSVPNV